VARGIQPSHARKAAMFQLAAEIPAPVLAELLGLSPTTASRWASLAARDWSHYTAMRRNARDIHQAHPTHKIGREGCLPGHDE
jgi:hypothetical protein